MSSNERQSLFVNGAPAGELQERPAGAPAQPVKPLPEDALILIPVRNVVLFPGVILPISMRREKSVAAAQEAARSERPIGLLLQRDAANDTPGPEDLYWVGTVANVLRYVTTPDGTHHIVAQGESRFRVLQFLEGWPFMVARVQRIQEEEPQSAEIEARVLQLKERTKEILELLPQVPAELANTLENITSAGALADLLAGFMDLKPEEKQELLETFDLKARLDRMIQLMAHRIEVLKLSREISQQTKQAMDERHREVLLREQLRAIQKELGEGDEQTAELEELAKAIEEAKMPEEVATHAKKELKRLQRMSEGSGEYPMIRTYLDWLIELPWSKESGGSHRHRRGAPHPGGGPLRPGEGQAADPGVPGGEEAQPRRARARSCASSGPPGVGKTSLGPVHRAGHQPQVRARLAGRRARRGGDPGPPAHLHRGAARQHHPGDSQGAARAIPC
ncbi:MAG: hypothetical protein KatS3mg123_2450 [Burkholderiales bacterium]|nr:MAG: hypothetical protein KatS3mg123_2450 [Burkholderiales bacterium]